MTKPIETLATEIYYAQSKGVDISVDDWIKKLTNLLKTERKELLKELKEKKNSSVDLFCEVVAWKDILTLIKKQ